MRSNSSDSVDETRTGSHWREYPLSSRADRIAATHGTLTAVLIGAAAAGVLFTVLGLVIEEGAVGPVTAETEQMLSIGTQASMGTVICLTLIIGYIRGVAKGAHEVAASRTLVAATQSGAPKDQIPHPDQMDRATQPTFGALMSLCAGITGFGGIIYLIGVATFLDSPDDGVLQTVLGVSTVVLVMLVATMVWIKKAARPKQAERANRITAHWSRESQQQLWDRVENTTHEQRNDKLRARTKRGDFLISLGFFLIAAGILCFQILVVAIYPEVTFGPGQQLGDRADLSQSVEAWADRGMLLFAGLMLAGGILLLIGTLASGAAERTERARLRAALAEPHAGRPGDDILQYYSQRRAILIAQWVGAVGGFGLSVGLCLTYVATGGIPGLAPNAEWVTQQMAPWAPWIVLLNVVSLASILAGIAWNTKTNRRDRDLRNELYLRWPVLPNRKEEDEDED